MLAASRLPNLFTFLCLLKLIPMDKTKLDEYRQRLEKERLILLNDIEKIEKPVDFGPDPDTEEESDEAEEISNQLAISHNLKNRLDEIDLALSKIQNGTYGVCENCGKNIDLSILEIDPESRLCKNCKSSR